MIKLFQIISNYFRPYKNCRREGRKREDSRKSTHTSTQHINQPKIPNNQTQIDSFTVCIMSITSPSNGFPIKAIYQPIRKSW